MKLNSIILLVLVVSFSLKLNAQIKSADKLFEKFDYSKAATLYKKAFNSKDEAIRFRSVVRIADCYRLMNDAGRASEWYQKAIEITEVDPINYFYLGKALRTQAKYDEAERAFYRYSKLVPDDFKGSVYSSYCKLIRDWDEFEYSANVENVNDLNTPFSEFAPVYYLDGLVITSDRDIDMLDNNNYHWSGNSYLDVYFSKPMNLDGEWERMSFPEKMSTAFNKPYHDGPICFTSDFKEAFITRTTKTNSKIGSTEIYTNRLKIFYAKLDRKKPDFTNFSFNEDSSSVGHPAISPDGQKLIFSSDTHDGFGESDLYLCTKKDGQWETPINLGKTINSFGNEVFPSWSNNSTLHFASDGHLGYGGLDIYETTLNKDGWSKPRNLKAPINSSYDDFAIAFNPESTGGFFSSNRPGGTGSDDIYSISDYRMIADGKEFQKNILITGYAKDKVSKELLSDALVYIYPKSSDSVHVVKTKEDGSYQLEIRKGNSFVIKGEKVNYAHDCFEMTVDEKEELDSMFVSQDLLLDKYERNQLIELPTIHYDLDKWNLREDAKIILMELVMLLKDNPLKIEIGAHTDSRGSSSYNMHLSSKRAKSVRMFLIENEIPDDQLTFKGYGESQPIFSETTLSEEQHQANRRTEFKILEILGDEDPGTLIENAFNGMEKISIRSLEVGFFDDCISN